MRAKPFRAVLFPERPEAMLIVMADGDTEPITLPTLAVPFTKADVAKAMGDAGLNVRISEQTTGRWGDAIVRAKRDAANENRQMAKLREAAAVSVGLHSADGIVRDRSAILKQKLAVDEQIADIKAKIGKAKSDAAIRRVYLPASEFRGMQDRLERLKVQSQGLQVELSNLKTAEKARNVELAKSEQEDFARRFVAIAKEILDPADFADICEAAEDSDEDHSGVGTGL